MKPKLSAYVSDHVAKRLAQAASRPGTNKSAIVDAALDRFLNPERDQSGDAALVRRLDRMSRQLDRMDRDLSITAETIALFVRYYLTITPPLPSGDQNAARALGRERLRCSWPRSANASPRAERLVADVMERVSTSNPDLFLRNLEEGAPLGQPTARDKTDPRATEATGEPPEHPPEGREEVGYV
ncbi:CopG family transcriptional regulator [Bradyrhizobium sp. RDT10]